MFDRKYKSFSVNFTTSFSRAIFKILFNSYNFMLLSEIVKIFISILPILEKLISKFQMYENSCF